MEKLPRERTEYSTKADCHLEFKPLLFAGPAPKPSIEIEKLWTRSLDIRFLSDEHSHYPEAFRMAK